MKKTEHENPEDAKRDGQMNLFGDLPPPRPKFKKTAAAPAEPPPVFPTTPRNTPPPEPEEGNIRSSLTEKPRIFVGTPPQMTPDGTRALVTGVYRHPNRLPDPPPAASQKAAPERPDRLTELRNRMDFAGWGRRIKEYAARIQQWFEAAEIPRAWWIGIGVAALIVAFIALLSACPRQQKPAAADIPEPEVAPASAQPASVAPPPTGAPQIAPIQPVAIPPVITTPEAVPAETTPPPAATATPVALPDWTLPQTRAEKHPDHLLLQFDIPIFVSADNISVEGMKTIDALAARLKNIQTPTLIQITGHTDDEQIQNPRARFKSNRELAAARAHQVKDHLEFKTRNKHLRFEEIAAPGIGPYPNDTPANRRLNRTVTIRLYPEN